MIRFLWDKFVLFDFDLTEVALYAVATFCLLRGAGQIWGPPGQWLVFGIIVFVIAIRRRPYV